MAKKKIGSKKKILPIEDDFQESPETLTPAKDMLTSITHYPWIVELVGLFLLLIIGLSVRLEDISDWKANPKFAMYKGEPLLTTFDGYYYLTLARDLAEGTYTPVDYRRAVPDYPKRPSPPPLLSVIGALIHKISGISFNWIGAISPAFLGMLLMIPLYLMGRYFGGPLMAFTGTLMGLLSYYYLYRSSIGWFDTDCMNVTWAVSAAYLFLKFGTMSTVRRYIYCAGGFLIWFLFMWWWDQTPYIATVLSLLPFFVAIIFFYRPSKREGLVFLGAVAVLALVVIAWKGMDFPIRIINNVIDQYKYISKEASPDFPNLGLTISEQARPTFEEIVAKTTDSKVAFFLSILGLGLLIYKRPKDSLFLSVPVVLATFSFFFAKRFLIFMSPVTAMGLGYFVYFLWRLGSKFWPVRLAVPIIIAVLAYFPFQKGMTKTFWPKEPPHLIDGMVYASKHTPKDAVIWAWWDHGYPLIYFSNRGTVNDGSAHSPERSVYNGVPLASSSQRFAANFMRFYVARGLTGISKLYDACNGDKAIAQKVLKEVLNVGPEKGLEILKKTPLKAVGEYDTPHKWLRYFFPKKARPVYLFLDWRLTVTSYWWYWLGSWDIKTHNGIHPLFRSLYNLKVTEKFIKGPGLLVDIDKGILRLNNGKELSLKKLVVIDKHPITKIYPRSTGLHLEVFRPAGYGAIMDFNMADSLFSKLFVRHSYDPTYFKPIRLMTPSHQIWEVRGDTL